MVFEKWVNYLINIICGAYKIDPAEINFPNNGGVGGKGSSLFSGDGEKIDNSKQKGLFPLLKFIENTINKNIIEKFNTEDEYKFVFDGIDNESESEQVDLAKKKTESYMTINEVRAEKGLPEIEGGDIIANPYYVQAKQMAPGGGSMDFDFDSYGDDDEEGGDDTEIEDEETSEDLFQKSLRQVNKEIELEKKLDRSKLVLMDTQVNDKYGTHTAKRWKNPAAALKELKRQMKVPKGATLTFIDKNKKEKKLTEKQFKDYCRKVKPNITLQQFIKENFIIKVNNPGSQDKIVYNRDKKNNDFRIAGLDEYFTSLKMAKKTQRPNASWRVDDSDKQHFKHSERYVTKGGSVIAVTNDGDIIGLCKNRKDKINGKELLKFAVKNGGKKLDSFSGNHDFYTDCGFEPVSWCDFDKNYAPNDWVEGRDKEEIIIFYKYVGHPVGISEIEFIKNTAKSRDYDDACETRDISLKGR